MATSTTTETIRVVRNTVSWFHIFPFFWNQCHIWVKTNKKQSAYSRHGTMWSQILDFGVNINYTIGSCWREMTASPPRFKDDFYRTAIIHIFSRCKHNNASRLVCVRMWLYSKGCYRDNRREKYDKIASIELFSQDFVTHWMQRTSRIIYFK